MILASWFVRFNRAKIPQYPAMTIRNENEKKKYMVHKKIMTVVTPRENKKQNNKKTSKHNAKNLSRLTNLPGFGSPQDDCGKILCSLAVCEYPDISQKKI